LRKFSLDELPQFWNILKGEMSLVGPRPIGIEEAVNYADGLKFYTKVLPGLTGLWQVSGRSNLDYRLRAGLDEYYVRNWSLWLDINIIIRTIKVVLFKEGAY
jgi:lipopolysaccharide/colanic/teichoic acid biosynthesis glycosyltransferase